jgi:hypothetical protein
VSPRGSGRILFVVGFALLLLDGAAAVWLGQVTDRRALVVAGLVIMLAAVGLVVAYQRWMRALEEVDAARRELEEEIIRLRQAADAARSWRRS